MVSPALIEHELTLPSCPGGQRLDQALAQALPQYSRSRLAGWIREGAVVLDGRPARPRDAVYGGETVRVRAKPAVDETVRPERMKLTVRHRDPHVFVIDKPAGLVVHPGAGNREHTLQNGLLALDPKLAAVPRAGIVHRIDKDTSGLLVVARTLEAHAALVEMLREHAVQREYLALCVGALTGGGTIDRPIGRHRTDRLRMAVRADGREAITHYRLVERFPGHSLLRVILETGRTHQIRVHLAHIGHPLVGDPLYGGRRQLTAGASPALREALSRFGRQALHAARLTFGHPVTGRTIDVESPLPADFKALLAALRAG
ncbi:MAG: 23S rRNA pseudouridine(1911/1915/1917) synthase RluD [Pseudomonadota bacterium]|jgi:23S rRNA pseudouridine1911/1915/1917 synthase|nr:MAG: 23S rRNA pseudouridine(1911/1915/1917) synthase RluD [Pseudomonadota bacterium]